MAIESKMARGPIGVRPTQDGKTRTGWWWVVSLVLVVIIVVAWFYFRGVDGENAGGVITSGEYQAVFLDNGQVYFGKIENSSRGFYSLVDVFYLQSGAAGIDQVANLSLTKLGSEAHGPEDRMEINASHVLFIEDMKSDSKVVQAIQQYKLSK